MELTLVVAIIRSDKLSAAEEKLHEIGVRGITVIRARGFGEHSPAHDLMGRALMVDQVKLEIYVARQQSERVATVIVDAAHTGAGDGIVAILPVHRVYSITTRSHTIPNRATQASADAARRRARPE